MNGQTAFSSKKHETKYGVENITIFVQFLATLIDTKQNHSLQNDLVVKKFIITEIYKSKKKFTKASQYSRTC